jgi:hypothetical protein
MSRAKSITRIAAARVAAVMLSWARPTVDGTHQRLGDRHLLAYGTKAAIYSIGIGFSY